MDDGATDGEASGQGSGRREGVGVVGGKGQEVGLEGEERVPVEKVEFALSRDPVSRCQFEYQR